MINILNIEPENYSNKARQILKDLGNLTEVSVTRSELMAIVSQYDILIVRLAHQIDREVLNEAKRLKAIITATTGLDHIDVDFAVANKIQVISLRGEIDFLRTITATAEHTLALMLALIRKIPFAFDYVKSGRWDRNLFKGHEIHNMRLGLLGFGRVGTMVAKYALAFGMLVSAYDPYIPKDSWLAGIRRADSLEDLLKHCQILSIHIPLNNQTYGLISDQAISMMQPGAIIVNTSRGEILDEHALLAALTSEHLAGAALDVIINERHQPNLEHNLLVQYANKFENLILTPHIAGATYESMQKTEDFLAHKLKDIITRQPNWDRSDYA